MLIGRGWVLFEGTDCTCTAAISSSLTFVARCEYLRSTALEERMDEYADFARCKIGSGVYLLKRGINGVVRVSDAAQGREHCRQPCERPFPDR